MIPIAASAAISAVSSLASVLGASASGSSTSSTASKGTAAAAKDGNTVNQADFMQLLVAQLQNQDPLNPLDSANFSAQLAQFSSLQQLTEINSELKGAGTSGGSSGKFDAVGFLGKDVQGASTAIDVQKGVATTLDYTLDTSNIVEAKIVDARGGTVADLVLGSQTAGAHTFDLSQVPNAPKLGDGTYTLQLFSSDGQGTATPVTTIGGGVVTGVDLSGASPVLLIGDRRIALTDVRQVKIQTPTGA
jgi:flagellar basal-body rod modification protein FlgD